ncbi:MAG: hypothetical protein JXQ75_23290 [Phycisphaerae bacterium]|nr:hypothetical protein [Phycisphaerae bacterium]
MNTLHVCQRLVHKVAIVAALSVLPGAAAQAEDPEGDVLMQAQVSRQRQRTASQELVAGLDLTEGQARQLLTLLDRASVLHVDAYEEQARLLPDTVEAYSEFAREDSLNQGFTPEVERRTARIHHEERRVHDAFVEEMLELEEQAAEVLSSPQVKRIKGFKPGEGRGAEAGSRAGSNSSRKGRHNHRKAPRHGQRQQEQNRQTIVDKRLIAAREELAAEMQQIHPRLSPIGRYLLHPAAAEPLCQIAGTRPNQNLRDAFGVFEHGTEDYPVALCDQHKAEVAGLRAEINNWNLINGLHLGREQIVEIVRLCDDFEAQREAAMAQVGKGKARRNRNERAARVVDLEQSVERIMNPGQLAVLDEYKACLLPPKNLKNPVRAGQASDSTHYENWLTRARKMPFRRLRKAIDKVLDREAEHLGELSPDERQQRVGLMLDVVREAAEMSDVDFELSKGELAERLAPRDRPKELKDKVNDLARRKGLPGKIARFMLKPLFIEQLRERGRQLAEGVKAKPADLTDGPQAGDG